MSKVAQKILIILGPTSSGKSDIAIKLAKKFNGEIISADSRQVYRGMNVGTGKVERDQRSREIPSIVEGSRIHNIYFSKGIPHYMIDIVSPRADYNVAKFKKQAEKIISDILRRGKLPIICGGTGFWISAIVDDINFPKVKPDWKLRKKLKKHSAEKLFKILQKLDFERAETIDSKNKVRLIRAIEICKAIKKVPLINTRYQIPDTRYEILQIGLKLPREQLCKKIEKRVKARFRQGMITEVKKLHGQGLSWKKIKSFGLAYFWIPLYLQNKLSKKELIEKVTNAEKNYAKRQMTWFCRDSRIKWLKSYPQIEKSTRNFLKK
jgi:tRNA dimethylallyltransferase